MLVITMVAVLSDDSLAPSLFTDRQPIITPSRATHSLSRELRGLRLSGDGLRAVTPVSKKRRAERLPASSTTTFPHDGRMRDDDDDDDDNGGSDGRGDDDADYNDRPRQARHNRKRTMAGSAATHVAKARRVGEIDESNVDVDVNQGDDDVVITAASVDTRHASSR
jgi:hypothetical protein